jgi:anthranilate synthase/aminodeoxychorismate synthase-like glutamine amidotransferase
VILLVDNYDSFVYNLVQAILPMGYACEVRRNDQVSPDEIEALGPTHIVISPGPCTPNEAGVSCDVIRRFAGRVPILGVCLGHQCIGQVFGGRVVRAPVPVHGKTSEIRHGGQGVFAGLPDPFPAARYHSLVVERETLPEALEVTAWTGDGLIMGLRHRQHAVEGVQFHPESYMTDLGPALLATFLGKVASRTP